MNPDEIRRLECLRIAAGVTPINEYDTSTEAAIKVLEVAIKMEEFVRGTTQESE